MAEPAIALATAICGAFELVPNGDEPAPGYLTGLARAAWLNKTASQAVDPRTAGLVLQMLIQVLPKDQTAGLYAALKMLAHLADPQPMDVRTLDSLVDALAISPHTTHGLAGAMMEDLVRELGGAAMPDPLRTCIANYFRKPNDATSERAAAMKEGVARGVAPTYLRPSTQSSSLDPSDH